MADFGVQATQLSQPGAAGASPLAPVQEATPQSSVLPLLSNFVDIFNKGLEKDNKQKAEAMKQSVVSGFVKRETEINDAVATGQMSPAEASARSRANFNQYASGYSQYIGEFESAAKALKGFTEKGTVEDTLATEKKQREADIAQAQARGFIFTPGMSATAQNDQIVAAKTGVAAELRLSEFYKAQAEKRAQGTYDQAVSQREEKDMSLKIINEVASTNYEAFQSFSTSLAADVKSGKIAPDAATAQLSARFANISGAIQAAARTNPELAAPYRSLYQGMYDVAQKLLDPKSQAEDLENQLKILQTKMKLVAMGDPQVAAAVVANQLLPNNANLALSSAPAGIRAIAILSGKPVTEKGFTPQVIGDPASEPDYLKLLKNGLQSIKAGKVQDNPAAMTQATNSVNHTLKQTGELMNRGVEAKELKGVAEFFASAEYGDFAKSGTVDPQANQTAKKVFQLVYEPAIIKGVQEKLNSLKSRTATGTVDGPTSNSILEAVDIKFTGAGVVFTPKNSGLTDQEVGGQRKTVEELRMAQQAVNQLIHIGAHMEGTTDYAKYWEDNKHIYMPQVYSAYSNLNIGDIKNNMRYKGGDAKQQSSWEPVNGGRN